jgi:hypothetical protein
MIPPRLTLVGLDQRLFSGILHIFSKHHQRPGVPSDIQHSFVIGARSANHLDDLSDGDRNGDFPFATGINCESCFLQAKLTDEFHLTQQTQLDPL